MTNAPSLLSVQDLGVSFHSGAGEIIAAQDVSFSIQPGEIFALVGESGSGKSVTALSILQLLPYPSAYHPSGSITFKGEELMDASESSLRRIRGNRISMIFQEPMSSLNPLHTIGKQVSEVLMVHQKMSARAALEKTKSLFAEVGLAKFANRLDAYPHELSGGERQRVMIAMAIANEPDLLIADEPTTAIDVTLQVQILKLLKELQRKHNMAILLITHDLPLVRKMANRVAIMQAGKLVEQGETSKIFASPAHPYTQKLLASEPKGTALPAPSNAKPLISCQELFVHFPIKKGFFGGVRDVIKAVDGVSLSVKEATTLGIVGESGSGKTTLAFALLRLLRSKGRIVFMGTSLDTLNTEQLRPLRSKMQIVFQDPYGSLNPRMTIVQIIEEGLLVHEPALSATERMKKVDAILAEVGLTPEMKDRYPHEFSGGQRQRISIARAMVLNPTLVALDEPTSALDLSVQAQIIALLKKLQEKYRLSYLFISHDLRVVKAISHHLVVMRNGKVEEAGDTAAIFASPQQNYTRMLIDAAFSATI